MRKQIRQSDIFEQIATGQSAPIAGMTYCINSINEPMIVLFNNCPNQSLYLIDTVENRKQTIKKINKRLRKA